MHILASYRQQMADQKPAILIYSLIIFVLFVIIDGGISIFYNGSENNTISSNEMVTLVFLFVLGLCSFKETFLLSVQNGISRKTLFCGRLLTMVSVALLMPAVDLIIHLLNRAILSISGSSVTDIPFYGASYCGTEASRAIYLIPNFFMEFVLGLALMAAGYFITVLFYRLNKLGKILVGAGVPVLFNIVLPLLDFRFFHMAISKGAARLMLFVAERPSHLMITSILVCVAFCAAAFLLMRRAVVKRQ